MSNRWTLEDLVGHKVGTYQFLDDSHWMVYTNIATFLVVAEGDCCSESWFWHTEALKPLVGQTITGIREIAMPEWSQELHGESKQEIDCLYGYEITFRQGQVTLEFRNSSNGYYGGMLYVYKLEREKRAGEGTKP